uniref:Uncharacterized protein n=1 Tax=Anguilla anguilla TaxID=7936 RepID=A0A0E9UCM9_ANGAN
MPDMPGAGCTDSTLQEFVACRFKMISGK